MPGVWGPAAKTMARPTELMHSVSRARPARYCACRSDVRVGARGRGAQLLQRAGSGRGVRAGRGAAGADQRRRARGRAAQRPGRHRHVPQAGGRAESSPPPPCSPATTTITGSWDAPAQTRTGGCCTRRPHETAYCNSVGHADTRSDPRFSAWSALQEHPMRVLCAGGESGVEGAHATLPAQRGCPVSLHNVHAAQQIARDCGNPGPRPP